MELTETGENDIEFALFSALETTISANVDAEIAAKPECPLPFPKENLVNKILQKNLDQLEQSLYLLWVWLKVLSYKRPTRSSWQR